MSRKYGSANSCVMTFFGVELRCSSNPEMADLEKQQACCENEAHDLCSPGACGVNVTELGCTQRSSYRRNVVGAIERAVELVSRPCLI